MNEATEYLLNEAKNGDFDAAFHGLIELPGHLLPDLEDAYRDEADPEIRALIVEAVWQQRSPTSVEFLAVALEDPHPDVWKQALTSRPITALSQRAGCRSTRRFASGKIPVTVWLPRLTRLCTIGYWQFSGPRLGAVSWTE